MLCFTCLESAWGRCPENVRGKPAAGTAERDTRKTLEDPGEAGSETSKDNQRGSGHETKKKTRQ